MTKVHRRPRPADAAASDPPVGAGIENIGPPLAERFLRKNECNRALNDALVDRYARDMRSGKWRMTGEAIVVDNEGNLANGQHRLTAIIRAGVTLPFVVVRNVLPIAQEAMDSGKKRTLADVLHMRGEIDCALLASIVSWCYQYENDLLRTPAVPTNAEKLEWLDANPGVRGSLAWGRGVRRRVHVPVSTISGIYYEASLLHPTDIDSFYEQLISGIGLVESSPIFLLRRWLERMGNQRDKPTALVYGAIFIKALNLWLRGETIGNLYWRPGGVDPEPFPKIWIPPERTEER